MSLIYYLFLSDKEKMKLMKIYKEHQNGILLSVFLAIIGIILAGCILMPSLFYEQWIWKYYWGPIVSDAAGTTVWYNGVQAKEGYTLISELTYGVMLVIVLYAIYELLKKLKISIDWIFCLALLPYIVFGPVARVIEDTGYFNEPFVYWFISPLIYIQITFYVLSFLVVGYYLQELSRKKSSNTILTYALSIFVFVDICYTMVWGLGLDYGAYIINPLIFYLFSLFAFLPIMYRFLKKKTITVNTFVLSGGLFLLFPSLYLIARWLAGEQWGFSNGTRFDVFLLILGLVTLIAAMVYFVSLKYKDNKKFAIYKKPLNLTMIIGHMVDGITSYISIYDPLKMGLPKYLEKHPASDFLMETWPPLFPIVKFSLIIIVIYVFDVLYKQDLKDHMNLVNLLKIGIIILGLSPGLRDLFRVTMGV
jgi:uncharacterized membrane protein